MAGSSLCTAALRAHSLFRASSKGLNILQHTGTLGQASHQSAFYCDNGSTLPVSSYSLHISSRLTPDRQAPRVVQIRECTALHHSSSAAEQQTAFRCRRGGPAWGSHTQSMPMQQWAAFPPMQHARNYSTADVIQKLRIPSKQVPNPDEACRLAHMHEWKVLVVHPDCAVEERLQTAEALGLAPRDTSLFAPQPVGMPVQRATIVPRDRAVLVRTEIARTIIHPDKAIIFPCRKDRDTLRLMQSVVNNVSEAGPLPFELRVLEALLDETARHFERRQRRLELLALSIEEDIQKTLRQDAADLQRLLPIQRALTEVQHDVKEAREAIAEVLDDDNALTAVCISDSEADRAQREGRQAPSMQLAAALLGSYERQIQSVEGALREMSENLEVFREVCSMHLSATRNRIIRINLGVTVASFALTACIVPASFFGMNLQSGIEDHPSMFWGVVGVSTVASVVLFAAIYSYWKYFPHTKHQRRVADLKALRDLLLYHVDDLEDILEALQKSTELGPGMLGTSTKMGREEFAALVQSSIQDCQVRKDEIDLLYNLLDINRDGLLELKEVVKSQERTGHGEPFNDSFRDTIARVA